MVSSPEPHPISDTLIRKISELPSDRIAQVEDFVDFLRQRVEEAAEDVALRQWCRVAANKVLSRDWDNDDGPAHDVL